MHDWYRITVGLAIAVVMVFSVATRHWRIFTQWLTGIRGRDWTAVSAVIDVVSVAPQTEPTRYWAGQFAGTGEERIIGYVATLTYFYRNPQLQLGDYSRVFAKEADAEAWAASYKGRTVMVRVDPRDPTRSVLRRDEL